MSEAEARDRLHQAVAAASAKVPIGRSLITQLAVRGEPGAVLVDLSTDGAQLVVGATGSDALPGIVTPMLGSTTRFVLRHAWCPVTVVPSARLRRAAPEPIEPQSVAEYSSRQREDTTGGPDDPGFGDVPSARLPGAGS